jgi:hypothetical protein
MAAKQPKQDKRRSKRLTAGTNASHAPKPETDWVGVELAYTTTARSLEDIGKQFGVTKGRVSQKAKEMSWRRGSLVDRVRAKAEAKVAAAEAHAAGVQAGTEAAVDTTAVVMAATILRERRTVGRLMALAEGLLTELEKPARGKAARAVPFAQRIENLRKLGDTVTRLTTLERTVLGITDATPIDASKRMEEAVASGLDELRARFKARLKPA